MFRKVSQRTSMNSSDRGGSRSSDAPDSRSQTLNHPVQLRIDVPLLLTVAVLLIFGLLMVYSASYDPSYRFNEGKPFVIIQRQFLFMIVGIVIAVGIAFFNYHLWQRLAVPLMAITVISLIAVLFRGQSAAGVQRSLVGNSVQPSELAKFVIIIYLSVWLYAKREQLHQVSFGLIPLAVMLGILGGLIAQQPDLSALVTVIFLGGLMFFLAGGDLKQIAVLGVVALVAGWLVFELSATASARVGGFIAGVQNPLKAPDQVQRSIEAFVNGGWFGVGIGKGTAKLTALQVPHTDSIFAVIGEETGLIGAVFVLILFGILLWRGMKIARNAPDELGALLAAGLTLWIIFEAFVNMASVVNLIPYAGNALPFISVGGSNLVMTLVGVGILMNISRLSVQTQEENGRFLSAVVNLRGWNRRRRVSRTNHSASLKNES
jgi:cell division protein FtsW